ncbi:phage head closure protein [Paenibacillus taichungensis]|uniref:phage head closure protein n=1 Tax=Paenibacillus taichungensis TaxID=484184 RepID=UPI002DBB02BC|nr:phage head closure protein [Paenibacillus taichungensis]MEC0107266.1 phage head closure protein [Paenibacillus taichungensis]MEC0194802.1 phage head closure protein [Paenibacillus taichungensis]
MNAGKMRGKISVWGKEEYKNDLKENDYRDALKMEIWAEIIPQTASLQRAAADTILSNTTHKIIVRYKSGKGIKQDMWIIFREHRFEIKYILNPYFRNQSLEIFCEEVIG